MHITCPQCNGTAGAETWKLACPFCGALAQTSDWSGEDQILLETALKIPNILYAEVMRYIAMFRPQKSVLAKKKTIDKLQELSQFVNAEYVQWKNFPARPNTPKFWKDAMQKIFAQRGLRLPLTSHGYLRSIAYGMAEETDRENEYERNRQEREGKWKRDAQTAEVPAFERMSPEEMRRIREEKMRKAGEMKEKS